MALAPRAGTCLAVASVLVGPSAPLSDVDMDPPVKSQGWLTAIDASAGREARQETETFFRPRLAAVEASERTLAQALERADRCVAVRAAQQASVAAFLDESAPSTPAQ